MATTRLAELVSEPRALVEAFALANLVFLGLDILLAHSVDDFALWTQWAPVAVSAIGAPLLIVTWLAEARPRSLTVGRRLGLAIGWSCVACGIAGLLLHLRSHFFIEQTIRNLVYTAPFAAPLAYTGVGLLLILDRSRVRDDREWAEWVVLLALGGFAGNFVLALADHAQNGFFEWTEWIGVGAAALAVGFLVPPLIARASGPYLRLCTAIMGLQVAVGLLGFGLHAAANLRGPAPSLWENLVYGAPAFAPLLFANLALLGWIGLRALARDTRLQGAGAG